MIDDCRCGMRPVEGQVVGAKARLRCPQCGTTTDWYGHVIDAVSEWQRRRRREIKEASCSSTSPTSSGTT